MNSYRGTTSQAYSDEKIDTQTVEDDLRPYLSLFLKPMTNKKSQFSRQELDVMCKDPLHSPKLILYLIEFVKEM